MNFLARKFAEKRLRALRHREICQIAKDLREANKKMEPFRKLAEERRMAGVAGDGFAMRPLA